MVEKLNANVMHGKVSKVQPDSSQGGDDFSLWSYRRLPFDWLLALASLPIVSKPWECVCKLNYVPVGLCWVMRSDGGK